MTATQSPAPASAPARSRARTSARDLAQIAVFAALIAALGLPGALSIGGMAVPITFQTLGVMLAGAILGARKGALSVVLLLALVAAGLPLLAGGRGGIAVFVGPSVGYLIGWVLGAFVIGWLTARLLPRYRVLPALAATAFGASSSSTSSACRCSRRSRALR
ncbi:biotin transporter BioY [Agromyces flavus]|uniref:BioY family protein n=1 Tax=Agromyces flavus TaxID=589382 RepID=A0A1H1PEC2_9MICO|nr:BioY family protein [Agromyces flavus]